MTVSMTIIMQYIPGIIFWFKRKYNDDNNNRSEIKKSIR